MSDVVMNGVERLLDRFFRAHTERRWASRYGRSMWKGWHAAWSSRHWGPYEGQMLRHSPSGGTEYGTILPPTDDQVWADPWV